MVPRIARGKQRGRKKSVLEMRILTGISCSERVTFLPWVFGHLSGKQFSDSRYSFENAVLNRTRADSS